MWEATPHTKNILTTMCEENLNPQQADAGFVSNEETANIPVESTEINAETGKANTPYYESKEEIITHLKDLLQNDTCPERSDIEHSKQAFYKFVNTEAEKSREAYIAEHGNDEGFLPTPSPEEIEFKDLLKALKEKRSAFMEKSEKEKEENLAKKEAIIEKIKAMVEGTGDVNKNYNEFKELQAEWNSIKSVPASKVNELWKNYQFYVEQFYDLLKINKEFRDYDFKKNLEIKTNLCIAAEKLKDEPDVVSAFHQLQKLHQTFRDTGPVAKELREELWTRFKNASSEVNRRHQQHFENLKKEEQENQNKKTAICERIESIDMDKLKTFADWNQKTKEITDLQAEWKAIGFISHKANQKLFERFRTACDQFFNRKSEYFKELKGNMAANLEKKKELCEKAEALKESTDWKGTSKILTKLQREWKEIGPVQKKHSDAIWKRFIAACDYFFDQKNQATSTLKNTEHENLEKKKAIIAQLEQLDLTVEGEEAVARIKNIIQEFNAIGHVPFKEKDNIYNKFRELVDKEFNRLHISTMSRRLNSYREDLNKGNDKDSDLTRKRRELSRSYDILKSEIQTYENNLGFLSTSSQKGNSLVNELNQKVEKLKSELNLVVEKIKLIDDAIKEKEENKEEKS
jgi:hypothetical protein